VEAVGLLARTEGILLDPVYTGKALAGLVALVRQGRFGRGENVLFLHTGGIPGLFAHAGVF
jgi:D-cysteine desulfhydrase